ncbi:hypothetical protein [uncultured Bacteroides sp.]|uniref:hypothetical protein n=1 Tax=uncultured Bacteroides sp. TaxID=162156 RepID=UPI002AAC27DE|nr:hypothetical protein [uncultured Bacteroides sp.]
MKNVLLVFLILISVNVFSQQAEHQENGVNAIKDTPKEEKDSVKVLSTVKFGNILYNSGKYLRKSAYYEYGAIGSLTASTVLFLIAFNNIDFWDNGNLSTSAFSALAATLFFTSAIVCTVVSIKYDKKAGKELKLLMHGGTGSIALTF